jgi:hypothetical protein
MPNNPRAGAPIAAHDQVIRILANLTYGLANGGRGPTDTWRATSGTILEVQKKANTTICPVKPFRVVTSIRQSRGMGAVAFNGLIHNLLFLGKLPWIYDTNVHTPSYSISNSNM